MAAKIQDGAMQMALSKVPGWIYGIAGAFLLFMLTLQFTGWQGQLQRVVDIYIKQLEANTSALTANTEVMKQLVDVKTKVTAIDGRLLTVETQVRSLESENAQMHPKFNRANGVKNGS